MRLILAASTAFLSAHATQSLAQEIASCDDHITVTSITEPWEDNSLSFAEGAIRVFEAYIDPNMANGAVIGVLHPVPADPFPMRACTAIIFGGEMTYFGAVLIAETVASYDPATGLTLTVPVVFSDNRTPITEVRFTINQATGMVTLQ